MIPGEDDVEIHALKKRGWSIAAIARHSGHDPKTVRAYLSGEREPGVRAPAKPDEFEEFVPYVRARFAEDAHVWASALFDEAQALGYAQSYQTFTRRLRELELRPHCEACAGVKGRATIEIEHPPGEEIQWDWLELPEAAWGDDAHLLLGSLPCSGKFRGVFADAEDQGHLIEGIHAVLERLGGTAKAWRVDRMATVINPGSGSVQRSFLPVAKHYGVSIVPCPPRRGNRKGSVEKSIHFTTQRWWRTANISTMVEAQASFDRFCVTIGDARKRPIAKLDAIGGLSDATRATFHRPDGTRVRPTVAQLAEHEPLLALPFGPYPATIEVERQVGSSCLVAFRGNFYDVPGGLANHTVTVRLRVGSDRIDIVTTAGRNVAAHRLEPAGCGVITRDSGRRSQLENVILGQFSTDRPCNRKHNIPPGPEARAEAARLLGVMGDGHDDVVVDLADYERIAREGGQR
jgi:transposase